MNCAYHSINTAVVNCNGCGRPLCPACDHRIKGFPFCQDCIVTGVGLLRDRQSSAYVPLVKKQTYPILATLLSLMCPGLGAAYNGQSSKALIHFAVFVGLFQLAILTSTPLFVFGFLGMWLFAAVDAYRSAQLIRSGISPDGAEDIIMKRISANPKLWGFVLLGIGALFFLQAILPIRAILKPAIPIMIIVLGLYMLRRYYMGTQSIKTPNNYLGDPSSGGYSGSYAEADFRTGEFETRERKQSGSWRG